MLCEHFEDALIEAAASGVAPQGELRAHLDACASCRALFAQEQSLFGAIDSGVRAAGNAEVPASLLPRVRASLDEAVVTQPRWIVTWPVLAGAAVCVVILFTAIVFRQSNRVPKPNDSIASNSSAPPANVSPRIPDSAGPSLRPAPSAPPPVSVAKNMAPRQAADSYDSTPQVLVPRDQELLLASYAQQWSSQKRGPLVAGDTDQTVVALLEVTPIQITQLDVKPLAEGNSQ